MTRTRLTLGQRGEQWVAATLQRSGYTILARNWRHPRGELDIIARCGEEIVFVEVRTRRGPVQAAIAAALESITPAKKARLRQLALAYLDAHGLDGQVWRIDVAAVGEERDTFSMEMIRDAVDW